MNELRPPKWSLLSSERRTGRPAARTARRSRARRDRSRSVRAARDAGQGDERGTSSASASDGGYRRAPNPATMLATICPAPKPIPAIASSRCIGRMPRKTMSASATSALDLAPSHLGNSRRQRQRCRLRARRDDDLRRIGQRLQPFDHGGRNRARADESNPHSSTPPLS